MDVGEELRTHIDRHLGRTPSRVVAEDAIGVHVATFDAAPTSDLFTAVTIGLSGHVLKQPRSGNDIRQELITCADKKYSQLGWADMLLAASKILLMRHRPFMLGEVVGPHGLVFPEVDWCGATALLCTPPAFFDPDFSEIDIEGTPLVFVELIPITTGEAEWVKARGWPAFFDRVNSGEINTLDLHRR